MSRSAVSVKDNRRWRPDRKRASQVTGAATGGQREVHEPWYRNAFLFFFFFFPYDSIRPPERMSGRVCSGNAEVLRRVGHSVRKPVSHSPFRPR